jgi:hypothetical protein
MVIDNAIDGGGAGIVILVGGGSPALIGNTVEGASRRDIPVGDSSSSTPTGNRVCGNGTNAFVDGSAEPVLDDNDICLDAPAANEKLMGSRRGPGSGARICPGDNE